MANLSVARARIQGWGSGLRANPAGLVPLLGALLLIYLVIFPLIMLIVGSFQGRVAPGQYELTLDNYVDAYTSPYTYSTFATSAVFGVGSALLALALGTGLAWLVERTNVPFARLILPIAVIPLILPGILDATAWIFLLSPQFGYINVVLQNVFGFETAPFNIYTLPGMIWVQAVGQVPLAFLMMGAAFKLMDPSLEESSLMSGATRWQTFRRVTLPLMWPMVASSFLLLLVRSLEAFEVPAIIGFPARTFVFTNEIYTAFRTLPPNYGLGSALAVGLLVLSAIGVALFTRSTRGRERFATVSGKAFRPTKIELGRWRWPAFTLLAIYALIVVAAPFLVIFWASLLPFFAPPTLETLSTISLDNYVNILGFGPESSPLASYARLFRTAMVNSVLLAVLAATFVMLLTSVIAWLVYKSRMRGATILEYLATIPIAIPGLVLGMAFIVQYVNFPLEIYGTVWVLLIAYTTKYLPYGMRNAAGSILQIRNELEESASMSGASWWQTFRRVTLPLIRPGFVAGWIYVAIVSFREFSTSILLVSGESMVLSVLVWRLIEFGQTTAVAAVGVVMIVTLVAIVGVFYRLTGRIGVQV